MTRPPARHTPDSLHGWTARAPAKVNLDLRIVDTRPDGFHALDTVFQSLALADTLSIQPHAGPFALLCAHPGVPVDRTNLAWRGSERVARAAGRTLDDWRLTLDKCVPAQAGLGGGSSDAVAAARLCVAAWELSWDDDDLVDLLAPLGADVAFFVTGGTMRGEGRGDELTALPDVPPVDVVVVRPPFGVATAEAYGWYDLDPVAGTAPVGSPPDGEGWLARWPACGNDLQPAVVARHPEIDHALHVLRGHGAQLALMSGSGSACFGLFDASGAADAAASHGWAEGWHVWRTRTLSRSEYRVLTTPSPLSDRRLLV